MDSWEPLANVKILYITTNFEALTHTFITREVEKVRQAGNDVELLALRQIASEKKTRHPECDVSGCKYVYPVGLGAVLGSTIRCLFKSPGRFFTALKKATSDPNDSIRIKMKLGYQLMVATTLSTWVEERSFDHIHAHFASPPTTFAMYLHFLTGVPFSFTGHAADIFRDTSAMTPKIANATGVVCISEYNRNYFKTLVPDLDQTEIVHCSINLENFSRREKNQAQSPLAILAVGRCVPKKGFADLLSAFETLDQNGLDWRGTIAGDGPLLDELKAYAEELGITERLEFLGSVPQKRIMELIETSDVFVLPSVPVSDGDIDGIPVSLMEAMAMGCPVVSTYVSGIPELITDEKSGLLVQPNDPKALAVAIERLAKDPELYTHVAEGGRREVEENFNLALVGEQLTGFFTKIGKNHSRNN